MLLGNRGHQTGFVEGDGLKVRSRDGFSDLSRETEVTMMVESDLLFGDPPGAASATVPERPRRSEAATASRSTPPPAA